MKPISHKTLLRKSRNYRNEQAIRKLAAHESLKEWSKTDTIPIPKVPKQNLTPGLWYFIRQLAP